MKPFRVVSVGLGGFLYRSKGANLDAPRTRSNASLKFAATGRCDPFWQRSPLNAYAIARVLGVSARPDVGPSIVESVAAGMINHLIVVGVGYHPMHLAYDAVRVSGPKPPSNYMPTVAASLGLPARHRQEVSIDHRYEDDKMTADSTIGMVAAFANGDPSPALRHPLLMLVHSTSSGEF
jgi:hypothetical protein